MKAAPDHAVRPSITTSQIAVVHHHVLGGQVLLGVALVAHQQQPVLAVDHHRIHGLHVAEIAQVG